MRSGPIQILLVEDNDGDVRLTREAFRGARVSLELHVVHDGIEAMDFLRGWGRFRESPRPDLILLDLNMPRRGGREVLEELKQDPTLKGIPIIVLSTSSSQEDIEDCYRRHANCYLAKPVELEGFMSMVRGLDDLWLASLAGLRRGQG